ncbi:MAG: hypothetical protein JST12_15060 [Armatimonadetes bacterium]|nr:hypothetical protein [Armatimonadota bacterium]
MLCKTSLSIASVLLSSCMWAQPASNGSDSKATTIYYRVTNLKMRELAALKEIPNVSAGSGNNGQPPPPQLPAGNAASSALDELATKIQESIGKGLEVKADENGFWLSGSQALTLRARELLACHIDIPQPQVKMTIYAYRLNQSLNAEENPQVELFRRILERIRVYEAMAIAELAQRTCERAKITALLAKDDPWLKRFRAALAGVHILNDNRENTLIEALDMPKSRMEAVLYSNLMKIDPSSPVTLPGVATLIDQESKTLANGDPKAKAMLKDIASKLHRGTPFPLSSSYYIPSSEGANQVPQSVRTVTLFLEAWLNKNKEPEIAKAASYKVDLILDQVMNALNEDLRTIFQRPFIQWANSTLGRKPGSQTGADYLGELTVGTSSRYPVSLMGMATNSFKRSVPKTSLDETADSDLGKTLTDKFKLQGLSPQLNFLMGAMENRKDVYFTLAPGISFSANPVVTPDGSAALLELEVMDAISAHDLDADHAFTDKMDNVQMSPVRSQVVVNAHDLFELSTFNTQITAKGDPRWQIPGLSDIPFFGNWFRGRSTSQRRNSSATLIVGVTIVPRVIDLMNGYNP